MKNKLIIMLTFASFGFINANAQTEDFRKLAHFDKISTKEGYDIFLTQGTTESVKIVTENISPGQIITNVSGGTLMIGTKKGKYPNTSVKIYITFIEINSVISYGGGKIEFSPFKANTLSLKIVGSSAMKVPVEVNKLNIFSSGSGIVELTGKAENADIELSGSGKINALNLALNKCDIKLTGSGTANLNVRANLQVNSSGSGNVYYKGKPATKEINRTGSGNVESIP
ncbi:head GIN domain-containing protein [Pedobacter sp. D749]|uniref:head GIN domain-containing protein n=1 Tax=Pedobacter sp. D749 TaxID=2856523 RepID=UPI001C570315|nr:head GIN domain-containing protein [Pedobacter sp. D749]QXU43265.1 DUF2807 domain-containing protein [Pedobacter sp. D749]